jgi:hypothetical protein
VEFLNPFAKLNLSLLVLFKAYFRDFRATGLKLVLTGLTLSFFIILL